MKQYTRALSILLTGILLLTAAFTGCSSNESGADRNRSISQNHGDVSQVPLPVQDNGTVRLRVGTYNVQNCSKGEKTEQIAAQITAANLDVVCMQEMDIGTQRVGGQDLLKALAQATGLPYYHFYQTMELQGGGYGLGILSKYPLSTCSTFTLETKKKEEPRMVAQAALQAGSAVIYINNTHLSYESSATRQSQLTALQEKLGSQPRSLLMGDFNVESFAEFSALQSFTPVNTEGKPFSTYRGSDVPFLALDNILFNDQITASDAAMADTDASDHNLLWADVVIAL